MRINHLAVALLIAASPITGQVQGPDPGKVDDLATAISHAEGFGVRRALPSRYHNPGDLKALSASTPLAGQVRVGKAGHIVFKDDEAGKAALRDYIAKMMDGRSSHFHPDMTLNQVARRYAENWRPWVKIVSRELGVPPSTTLRAYFYADSTSMRGGGRRPFIGPSFTPREAPLEVSFRPLPATRPAADPIPLPPAVTVPESQSALDAMLDVPVHVPPLVEDDVPQHHKLRLFHPRAGSDGQAVSTVRVVSSMQDNRTTWR